MKHRTRERAIFALLDGRLDPKKKRALLQHLDRCQQCRTFHERAQAGRRTLRELGESPLPPRDWSRVDRAMTEVSQPPRRRPWAAPLRLVPVAIATASLAALWWWSTPPEDSAPTAPQVVGQRPDSRPLAATPLDDVAFVSFVAGQAVYNDPSGQGRPLQLDAPLAVGGQVQTDMTGTVGLQFGVSHGCRQEADSTVTLAELQGPELRLDLHQGKLLCQSETGPKSLVLAVMDLVASASGATRFAVEYRGDVTIVDLAQGRIRIDQQGAEQELGAPGRYLFDRHHAPALGATWQPLPDDAAWSHEAPPLWIGRPEAALHLPYLEGIAGLRVGGQEFGAQPLALRREPGITRVQFLLSNGVAAVRDFDVSVGDTRIDAETLLADLEHLLRRPQERRVARRMGTYNARQVAALRSLVGQRVRRCYERALLRNPSIWGRIRVHFTVSTAGEARDVRVHNLTGGHQTVNECITQVLLQERYPPPLGGYVPVEQDITLSPQF